MSEKKDILCAKMCCSPKKCYYLGRQNFTSHGLLLSTARYKTIIFFFGGLCLAVGAIFARSSAGHFFK